MKPMTPAQFKAARLKAHYTPTSLSKELNVERSTIYNWEKGITPISVIVTMAMKYLRLSAPKK